MIRFEYEVLKPFTIFTDEEGEKIIAQTEEEKKSGTSFSQGTKYVAYKSKEDEIKRGELTHDLSDQGYLKLIKKDTIPEPEEDED